jgi:hypothetical protein
MTEERLALSELLEKAGEGDFLRTVVNRHRSGTHRWSGSTY